MCLHNYFYTTRQILNLYFDVQNIHGLLAFLNNSYCISKILKMLFLTHLYFFINYDTLLFGTLKNIVLLA